MSCWLQYPMVIFSVFTFFKLSAIFNTVSFFLFPKTFFLSTFLACSSPSLASPSLWLCQFLFIFSNSKIRLPQASIFGPLLYLHSLSRWAHLAPQLHRPSIHIDNFQSNLQFSFLPSTQTPIADYRFDIFTQMLNRPLQLNMSKTWSFLSPPSHLQPHSFLSQQMTASLPCFTRSHSWLFNPLLSSPRSLSLPTSSSPSNSLFISFSLSPPNPCSIHLQVGLSPA